MVDIYSSVFSDGTRQFRIPAEPKCNSDVRIRIRTATEGVDSIKLIAGTRCFNMTFAGKTSDGHFDLYEAKMFIGEEPVHYYFELILEGKFFTYDRLGLADHRRGHYDFVVTPDFKIPEWAKGAVIYQIYVDRFCNGDPNNDVLTDEYCYINEHVKRVDNWDRYPSKMDVRDFYGGDLAGVKSKLDYLQDLGVEVIYLNPIFTSPSNHKYDAQDYDCIDPHYGVIVNRKGDLLAPGDKNNAHASAYIEACTNEENKRLTDELFISLVEEIHKRGMKIILDGVFNHCGSFNKWLDAERLYENCENVPKGAYVSKDSPYRNYFSFNDDNAWPYNSSYDGWWGHNTLPKLNYEGSRELYDYILNIGRKWVSPPYNCDGWRLDVAADLGHSPEANHKFWQDFRTAVKEANPNAIILAEHYGDPESWLRGKEWDTIMNYDAFMEPVTWFFTGIEKHSDACKPELLNDGKVFAASLRYNRTRMQTGSILSSMNELSNHDHSRFLTRTNMRIGRTESVGPEAAEQGINKAIFREAVMFQMTWPGSPTVYYGDEAGVCGWTDPDNRRTYPWGREDKDLLRFHKEMIAIHRSYQALRTGSTMVIMADRGIFAFGRFDDRDRIVVVFNNNFMEREVHVPVSQIGIAREEVLVRLCYTNHQDYAFDSKLYVVTEGHIRLVMPPHSAIVLKNIRR